MTKENQKNFSILLCDFDWFLQQIETELINVLYDSKLLDDFEMKNPDTKKTLYYVLLKKIIEKVYSHPEKCVILVKPEIVHSTSELLAYYNNVKLRRLIMTLFKFMIKNKFNVFVFMTKSYSEKENANLIEHPEVRDFLDLHVEKTGKRIGLKSDTVHLLFEKLCKKIKQ